MMQFFAPIGTIFIGLAMFIYGSLQALVYPPPAKSFEAAAQAMPDAVAVIVFGFGIAAVVVGIVLLVSGIKGVRSRTREIHRAYGPRPRHHRHPRDEYDGWDDHPAYS